MQFLGFSNHEKGGKKKLLMVCSMFLKSGWSVIRSASLAKGGTSKKRPLLHFHKLLTQSNKVSSLTFQMALVNSKQITHSHTQTST
jgi:hypothetical protein